MQLMLYQVDGGQWLMKSPYLKMSCEGHLECKYIGSVDQLYSVKIQEDKMYYT
jgi:hypothetical protein